VVAVSALQGLTSSGNDLVAMVGYAVVLLSIVYAGLSVAHALICRKLDKD
jgi:NhaP-type Na+/H+ or K+/H+ antiporter